MLTKAYVSGTIKGEIEMEAIRLKKKKKKASKKFKSKIEIEKNTPIIHYSKLGLPIISNSHEIFERVLKDDWLLWKILHAKIILEKNNKKNKNNKHKDRPIPIIQYSELGLPAISSKIRTLRQMYKEDKWN